MASLNTKFLLATKESDLQSKQRFYVSNYYEKERENWYYLAYKICNSFENAGCSEVAIEEFRGERSLGLATVNLAQLIDEKKIYIPSMDDFTGSVDSSSES